MHRDLKPANIKLRPDGTVKVLDFGLAKAHGKRGAGRCGGLADDDEPGADDGRRDHSRDGGVHEPRAGEGRAADKRSDVWAFGCVLYEMLTGARAFPGEDVSDTLAAVLRGEPAWGTLPAETPAAIRRLLRRCLEKDRKRRLSDAADARLEIEDALTTPAAEVSAAPTGSSQGGWRRAAIVSAVALASAVVSGTVIWMATRSSPPRVTRTTIEVPGMSTLTGLSRHFSITPDASRVVYQGLGEILVRRFDQLEPTPLGGLGRPQAPFVSRTASGWGSGTP